MKRSLKILDLSMRKNSKREIEKKKNLRSKYRNYETRLKVLNQS